MTRDEFEEASAMVIGELTVDMQGADVVRLVLIHASKADDDQVDAIVALAHKQLRLLRAVAARHSAQEESVQEEMEAERVVPDESDTPTEPFESVNI